MISNDNYRSGSVRSVPDSEAPRRVSEVRSGSARDQRSAKKGGMIRVEPSVKIIVRNGKLEVVGK
jgi:hypothetical protein